MTLFLHLVTQAHSTSRSAQAFGTQGRTFVPFSCSFVLGCFGCLVLGFRRFLKQVIANGIRGICKIQWLVNNAIALSTDSSSTARQLREKHAVGKEMERRMVPSQSYHIDNAIFHCYYSPGVSLQEAEAAHTSSFFFGRSRSGNTCCPVSPTFH